MAMSKNEYFVENTSNKCIAFRNMFLSAAVVVE